MRTTADIIAAFVSNNAARPADMPDLIRQVHAALDKLLHGKPTQVVEALVPTISIKKSIQRDYLISMEDGRPYKMLRRHLNTRGLTFEQYRAKWHLPPDYPSVCPAYSEMRSGLAKAAGLGNKGRNAEIKAAAASTKTAEAEVTSHSKAEQTRRRRTQTSVKTTASPA